MCTYILHVHTTVCEADQKIFYYDSSNRYHWFSVFVRSSESSGPEDLSQSSANSPCSSPCASPVAQSSPFKAAASGSAVVREVSRVLCGSDAESSPSHDASPRESLSGVSPAVSCIEEDLQTAVHDGSTTCSESLHGE